MELLRKNQSEAVARSVTEDMLLLDVVDLQERVIVLADAARRAVFPCPADW